MSLTLVSPPMEKAVTLSQIKHHLRLELDDDDDYLLNLIDAATDCVQNTIRQKLITQVWRQYSDCNAGTDEIKLEVYPVQAVEQLTVYDGSGVSTQLNDSYYKLRLTNDRPSLNVELASRFLTLEVDVRCGYGDNGEAVPSALRQALTMLVAHWYEFRGATAASDQPISLPSGYHPLINPYRRPKL